MDLYCSFESIYNTDCCKNEFFIIYNFVIGAFDLVTSDAGVSTMSCLYYKLSQDQLYTVFFKNNEMLWEKNTNKQVYAVTQDLFDKINKHATIFKSYNLKQVAESWLFFVFLDYSINQNIPVVHADYFYTNITARFFELLYSLRELKLEAEITKQLNFNDFVRYLADKHESNNNLVTYTEIADLIYNLSLVTKKGAVDHLKSFFINFCKFNCISVLCIIFERNDLKKNELLALKCLFQT